MSQGGILEAGLLLAEVVHAVEALEVQVARDRRAEWRDWAIGACSRGASRAHRWSRPLVPVPALPIVNGRCLMGLQALEHVTTEWLQLWRDFADFQLPLPGECVALPPLADDDARLCLRKSSPKKAGGVEGFNMHAVSWLPESLFKQYMSLVRAVEFWDAVPDQMANQV
eukprot:794547-Amphidinium_carterae.1